MSDVVWAEFNMSLELYLTGRHISFEQQQDSIPSFVDLAVLKSREAGDQAERAPVLLIEKEIS